MMYSDIKKTKQLFRYCKSLWRSCLTRAVMSWCVVCVLLLCGAMQVAAQTYFRTVTGTPHIPVLSVSPAPASAGAIYINSIDGKLYWYDGKQWVTLTGSLVPVLAPDGTAIVNMTSPATGRIWMDRNMGATQAATSATDGNAYGSLYQWCRGTDGHQLRGSATYAGPVESSATDAGNDWYGKFITNTAMMFSDWQSSQQSDGSLWWNGTVAGANTPCPTGYHVPTQAEWQAEGANVSANLNLPNAGVRVHNGSISTNVRFYWSSTSSTTIFAGMFNGSSYTIEPKVFGISVRCIKNQ